MNNRILALDIHTSHFGFALFEGNRNVVDWGIRYFRGGVNAVKVPMQVKLERLVAKHQPDLIVVKTRRGYTVAQIVGSLRAIGDALRIPVRQIRNAAVRKTFPGSNRNKYEIASAITLILPDIAHLLGTRRKLWQAERYWMSLFEAASAGIAYFRIQETRALSPLPR